MKLKKIMAWGLAVTLSFASFLTVTASEERRGEMFYDVVTGEGVSREELKQYLSEYQTMQYGGTTTGNATLILPGDYLLDGNYENGELVNGDIYYSMEDAFWGVQQDKLDALELNAETSPATVTGSETWVENFR